MYTVLKGSQIITCTSLVAICSNGGEKKIDGEKIIGIMMTEGSVENIFTQ